MNKFELMFGPLPSYIKEFNNKWEELTKIHGAEIVRRAHSLAMASPYSTEDCIFYASITPDDEIIKKAFYYASRSHSGVCFWLKHLIARQKKVG